MDLWLSIPLVKFQRELVKHFVGEFSSLKQKFSPHVRVGCKHFQINNYVRYCYIFSSLDEFGESIFFSFEQLSKTRFFVKHVFCYIYCTKCIRRQIDAHIFRRNEMFEIEYFEEFDFITPACDESISTTAIPLYCKQKEIQIHFRDVK